MKSFIRFMMIATALIFFNLSISLGESAALPSFVLDAVSLTTDLNTRIDLSSIADNPESIIFELSEYKDNCYDARYENISLNSQMYECIRGNWLIKTDNTYKFLMTFILPRPFGETIDSCQPYIDAVNDYTNTFGYPIETRWDETNKAVYGRSSISWYSKEHDITISILYVDGDISNGEFPRIQTTLMDRNRDGR